MSSRWESLALQSTMEGGILRERGRQQSLESFSWLLR